MVPSMVGHDSGSFRAEAVKLITLVKNRVSAVPRGIWRREITTVGSGQRNKDLGYGCLKAVLRESEPLSLLLGPTRIPLVA